MERDRWSEERLYSASRYVIRSRKDFGRADGYIGVLSPAEDALYIPYANGVGPWDGTAGYISKYFIGNGTWVDVTPAQGIADNSYGYSGLSVDLNNPGTVVVAPFNEWYPDAK